jgi:hypothetical protein
MAVSGARLHSSGYLALGNFHIARSGNAKTSVSDHSEGQQNSYTFERQSKN